MREKQREDRQTGYAGRRRATSQGVQVASTSVTRPQGQKAQERMLLVLEPSADMRPTRT